MSASLEEQEFNELWGKKAKEVFNETYNSFNDTQLKKIIDSIRTLGASNLNATDRLLVSVLSSFVEGPPKVASLCYILLSPVPVK